MKRTSYTLVVGSLMYAMVYTRPNIAYAIGTRTHFLSNLGKEHWNAIRWIMRYWYGAFDLKLPLVEDKLALVGFTDAALAGDIDLASLLPVIWLTL